MILTRDNEYLAVLDTCVLAPMPLCDTLMRCAEEPALFRILWSAETLVELRRTLIGFGYTDAQADRRLRAMENAFPEARVSSPRRLHLALRDLPDPLPDPNDAHVVAAAIHEYAQAIVTHNLKHFPAAILEPHHILAQSPDDFLVHQFHLSEQRVCQILDMQASAIRQPRSEILRWLQVHAPEFVALVSG